MPARLDDQTVPSDFDVVRTVDRFQWRQYRHFDRQPRNLVRGDGREARIFAARSGSAVWDDVGERFVDAKVTDAAAQLRTVMQCHEHRGLARKDFGVENGRCVLTGGARNDRIAREFQQHGSIRRANHDAAPNRPSAAAK